MILSNITSNKLEEWFGKCLVDDHLVSDDSSKLEVRSLGNLTVCLTTKNYVLNYML